MPKSRTSQFIYSVALNRAFLLFPLVLICLLVTNITVEDLRFLFGHMDEHGYQNIIDNEATITILLIGFGAVMDGRKILSKRAWDSKQDPSLEQHKLLNETSEYYGFMLIVIGISIEIVDQLASYMRNFQVELLMFEAWFSIVLNIVAIGVMLKAAYKIAVIDKQAHQL
ncbi:hypothetical protein L1077_09895 [Pseudoalteromonas luteoviolacea]|uniref:Uncharacterized protein n=1 Tax=Pseudoalteromonas luteoviolacea H33 TaxID=1365251 RepID=A0A161XXK5_9GAMM|nr:hypothetical protein [Pseudoalteromonas luteoviolacea]KZN48039.1 hypothetical protein N476_22605 [Pseudoalteromonas luteoviolacea H33]KZN73821.1 hypothetical protein N477_22965 [Pseudoalteromonas luteoviolacea H33-S]MBQ4878271.1 hypothetical protein [Pseudoalteromonas luteoviolacea]MBQ4907426.1 hypothetical protein [Pseudoalteromonas luteoviolacea]MCF6439742.1 hypothetical protein [Pseudoalteromonas luteoviolacea]